MSFIDQVNAKLTTADFDRRVCEISDSNTVEILDTPNAWGEPMTRKGVSGLAAQSVADLAGNIRQMLGNARERVNVASLNPPDGVFQEALDEGFLDLWRAAQIRRTPVLVRFLFGYVPTRDTVKTFKNRLRELCERKGVDMGLVQTYVGQLCSLRKQSWNHSKIVAVDGLFAIVGGHNLWETGYGAYPPVHDISIKIGGEAAEHAHQFANFLWTEGEKMTSSQRITEAYGFEKVYPPLEPAEQAPAGEVTGRPRALAIDYGQLPTRTDGNIVTGRSLSLGRSGGVQSGQNASDVAKEVILTTAISTLKVCQQDLVFLGSQILNPRHRQSNQKACGWIARGLADNPELTAQVVVSPIDASGAGDQYSWGSGAIGTYDILEFHVKKLFKGVAEREAVLRRLCVAPFCFTDTDFQKEGKDYKWPDSKNARAGRFMKNVPAPTPWKYDPAPGNHAKVYIADDKAFYVGSDNLYPHDLVEFGYLIEGDAVENLLTEYWNRVWQYSGGHCVSRHCDAHSALRDANPPVASAGCFPVG